MIKKVWLKWVIILTTGAATYGMTYAAGQWPEWGQVFSMINPAIVLACGLLTGFPKKD